MIDNILLSQHFFELCIATIRAFPDNSLSAVTPPVVNYQLRYPITRRPHF